MKYLSYKFYLAAVLLFALCFLIISASVYIGWGEYGTTFVVIALNSYAYIRYYRAWKKGKSYWIGPIADYSILMFLGYALPCFLVACLFTGANNESDHLIKIAANSSDYMEIVKGFRNIIDLDSLNLNSPWGIVMACVSSAAFLGNHIAFYFCFIPALPMSKTWSTLYKKMNSFQALLCNMMCWITGYFVWSLIRMPLDFLFIAEIDSPWKNMNYLDPNLLTNNFTTIFITGPIYPVVISVCLAGALGYFMRETKENLHKEDQSKTID